VSQSFPAPPPATDACTVAPALAASAIERWLADAGPHEAAVVEVVATTASTNADLLIRCRQRQPRMPIVRAADFQTEGRGRRQRAWIARPRAALLFSVAVPLETLAAALPPITLAAGVALADYLHKRGVPVALKWPNDLLYEGRKLGGVLCELAVDVEGRATLVIGVGINGWLSDEERATIGQPVAALTEAIAPPLLAAEREAWIAQMARALLATVCRYPSDGFATLRERYNDLLQSRGAMVDIVDHGEIMASGRVIEVDSGGRLVLDTASGTRAISVGDISLRRKAP
jgi:BirA family biotin operon repressor/biotin-[acetyl-CoA-carboxylase] ligase